MGVQIMKLGMKYGKTIKNNHLNVNVYDRRKLWGIFGTLSSRSATPDKGFRPNQAHYTRSRCSVPAASFVRESMRDTPPGCPAGCAGLGIPHIHDSPAVRDVNEETVLNPKPANVGHTSVVNPLPKHLQLIGENTITNGGGVYFPSFVKKTLPADANN